MADVASMSPEAKVEEAIRRSLPELGPEARAQVLEMLSPTSLAIIAATLAAWAASHVVGVGEVVDLILLGVGFVFLGFSVINGANELVAFGTSALSARSDADLNAAGKHFAKAIALLGIATISALLLRRSASAAVKRGLPQIRSLLDVGPPPVPGAPLRITRPASLASGALGETDWWGNIAVTRSQTTTGQLTTLYHEWVHRALSPRVAPLRQLRSQFRASGYWRSSLLRYLEEALAESYAQLRMNGPQGLVTGIRFPIDGGYVTVSQLATEGIAIGNIAIGSGQFTVRIVEKIWCPSP